MEVLGCAWTWVCAFSPSWECRRAYLCGHVHGVHASALMGPCTPSPGHTLASWATAPTCVCSRGHSLSQPTSLPEGQVPPRGGSQHWVLPSASWNSEKRLKPALMEDACSVGTSGLLPPTPLHPDPALISSHVWETGLTSSSLRLGHEHFSLCIWGTPAQCLSLLHLCSEIWALK